MTIPLFAILVLSLLSLLVINARLAYRVERLEKRRFYFENQIAFLHKKTSGRWAYDDDPDYS